MLNRLSKPVKPAAIAAICASCAALSSLKLSSLPSSLPANTSCNSGDAMPRIPMPAETFRHSTSHTSANCGVFQATLTCTWRSVTMPLPAFFAGAVQPSGFQPVGGTR
ncbi:hypothetical protein D3C81_1627490 [compost metagenome]